MRRTGSGATSTMVRCHEPLRLATARSRGRVADTRRFRPALLHRATRWAHAGVCSDSRGLRGLPRSLPRRRELRRRRGLRQGLALRPPGAPRHLGRRPCAHLRNPLSGGGAAHLGLPVTPSKRPFEAATGDNPHRTGQKKDAEVPPQGPQRRALYGALSSWIPPENPGGRRGRRGPRSQPPRAQGAARWPPNRSHLPSCWP